MVAPTAGEVVLVPFPFSNLSHSKVRPGRCLLYFVRHPKRGWYIEYHSSFTQSKKPKRHLVAIDPTGDRQGWVEHWAEGDIAYSEDDWETHD